MKRMQLLCAMLTGGMLCTLLTGCVTVTNHYPGTIASQSAPAAPVYAASSPACHCSAMHQGSAASTEYAAQHRCGCPVCSFVPSNSGYVGYLPYVPDRNCESNGVGYSRPSYSDPTIINNNYRTYEPHVVYVPVTPPIVQGQPPVRTDADRTREVVDILIGALDALQERRGNGNSSGQGSGGSGSNGNTGSGGSGSGGSNGGGIQTVPDIALGGSAGSGGFSSGNPDRHTGAQTGSAGNHSSTTPNIGGTLTGADGRKPSQDNRSPEMLPSSENGSRNGTIDVVDNDSRSSGTLPSSANGSRNGTIDVVDNSRSPQTLPSSANNGGRGTGTLTAGSTSRNESTPELPSHERGGLRDNIRGADETGVRITPGSAATQSTASQENGSREAQLNVPPQRKESSAPVGSSAPSSVAGGSSRGEVREIEEPRKAEKQKAAEPTGVSTTTQRQTTSSPTVSAPEKVAVESTDRGNTSTAQRPITTQPATVAPAKNVSSSTESTSDSSSTASKSLPVVTPPAKTTSTGTPQVTKEVSSENVQTIPISGQLVQPASTTGTGSAVTVGVGGLSNPQ